MSTPTQSQHILNDVIATNTMKPSSNSKNSNSNSSTTANNSYNKITTNIHQTTTIPSIPTTTSTNNNNGKINQTQSGQKLMTRNSQNRSAERAEHQRALSYHSFHLLGTLGRGSFGVVYEALCQHSREIVAIKIISKFKAAEMGVAKRVVNEVSLHSHMRHPYIVDLLDFFEDNDNVYLVMEACTGGDMYQHLRRNGPLPYSEVQRLGAQLFSAVAFMHSKGILHRDLKLSNLLLRERMITTEQRNQLLNGKNVSSIPSFAYDLKVSDFGLAVQLSGLPGEEHRTICGTPNYIAPEVTAALPHSTAADVYSAGCLIYSMLFGRPPSLQKLTAVPKTSPRHIKNSSTTPSSPRTSTTNTNTTTTNNTTTNNNNTTPPPQAITNANGGFITTTYPAEDYTENLESLPLSGANLLRTLLAPFPGDRPSASSILENEIFAGIDLEDDKQSEYQIFLDSSSTRKHLLTINNENNNYLHTNTENILDYQDNSIHTKGKTNTSKDTTTFGKLNLDGTRIDKDVSLTLHAKQIDDIIEAVPSPRNSASPEPNNNNREERMDMIINAKQSQELDQFGSLTTPTRKNLTRKSSARTNNLENINNINNDKENEIRSRRNSSSGNNIVYPSRTPFFISKTEIESSAKNSLLHEQDISIPHSNNYHDTKKLSDSSIGNTSNNKNNKKVSLSPSPSIDSTGPQMITTFSSGRGRVTTNVTNTYPDGNGITPSHPSEYPHHHTLVASSTVSGSGSTIVRLVSGSVNNEPPPLLLQNASQGQQVPVRILARSGSTNGSVLSSSLVSGGSSTVSQLRPSAFQQLRTTSNSYGHTLPMQPIPLPQGFSSSVLSSGGNSIVAPQYAIRSSPEINIPIPMQENSLPVGSPTSFHRQNTPIVRKSSPEGEISPKIHEKQVQNTFVDNTEQNDENIQDRKAFRKELFLPGCDENSLEEQMTEAVPSEQLQEDIISRRSSPKVIVSNFGVNKVSSSTQTQNISLEYDSFVVPKIINISRSSSEDFSMSNEENDIDTIRRDDFMLQLPFIEEISKNSTVIRKLDTSSGKQQNQSKVPRLSLTSLNSAALAALAAYADASAVATAAAARVKPYLSTSATSTNTAEAVESRHDDFSMEQMKNQNTVQETDSKNVENQHFSSDMRQRQQLDDEPSHLEPQWSGCYSLTSTLPPSASVAYQLAAGQAVSSFEEYGQLHENHNKSSQEIKDQVEREIRINSASNVHLHESFTRNEQEGKNEKMETVKNEITLSKNNNYNNINTSRTNSMTSNMAKSHMMMTTEPQASTSISTDWTVDNNLQDSPLLDTSAIVSHQLDVSPNKEVANDLNASKKAIIAPTNTSSIRSALLLDKSLRAAFAAERKKEAEARALKLAQQKSSGEVRRRIRSGTDGGASKVLQSLSEQDVSTLTIQSKPIAGAGTITKPPVLPSTGSDTKSTALHALREHRRRVSSGSQSTISQFSYGSGNLVPIAVDLSAHGKNIPNEIVCIRKNRLEKNDAEGTYSLSHILTALELEKSSLRVRLWGFTATAEISIEADTNNQTEKTSLSPISLHFDGSRNVVTIHVRGTKAAALLGPRTLAALTASQENTDTSSIVEASATFPLQNLPSRFFSLYKALGAAVASIRERLPRLAILTSDATLAVLLDDGPSQNSFSFTLRIVHTDTNNNNQEINDVWRVLYWPRRNHLCIIVTPWGVTHVTSLSRRRDKLSEKDTSSMTIKHPVLANEYSKSFSQLPPASAYGNLYSPATLAADNESGISSHAHHSAIFSSASELKNTVTGITNVHTQVPPAPAADLPLYASSLLAFALRQHAACVSAEARLLPSTSIPSSGIGSSASLPVVVKAPQTLIDAATRNLLIRVATQATTTKGNQVIQHTQDEKKDKNIELVSENQENKIDLVHVNSNNSPGVAPSSTITMSVSSSISSMLTSGASSSETGIVEQEQLVINNNNTMKNNNNPFPTNSPNTKVQNNTLQKVQKASFLESDEQILSLLKNYAISNQNNATIAAKLIAEANRWLVVTFPNASYLCLRDDATELVLLSHTTMDKQNIQTYRDFTLSYYSMITTGNTNLPSHVLTLFRNAVSYLRDVSRRL